MTGPDARGQAPVLRFGREPGDRLGLVADRALALELSGPDGWPVWAPEWPAELGEVAVPESVTLVLVGWVGLEQRSPAGLAVAAKARDRYRTRDGRRWALAVPARELPRLLAEPAVARPWWTEREPELGGV